MTKLSSKSTLNGPAVVIITLALCIAGTVALSAARANNQSNVLSSHATSPATADPAGTNVNGSARVNGGGSNLSHGSAQLYLSPAKSTVANSQSITVQVRENSAGVPVNAVQANLTYPADKLTFVSVGDTGSAFSIAASVSGGGGQVSIARGTTTPHTGDQLVATITFKANASHGSAAVGFATTSALVDSNSHASILGNPAGATFQLSK